jgi:rod shape-determining protein MreD
MRWLGFAICALFALTVHSALAPRLELFGARPDWLLVLVVFFALYARGADAVVGAWIVGACADLMTLERVGLLSLSYGFAALAVVGVREYLFRYRLQTQFLVTLIAGLAIRLVWGLYRFVAYPEAGWTGWAILVEVVVGAVYTAAFAPPVHKVLLSMPRMLGLPKPRYTYSGPLSTGS